MSNRFLLALWCVCAAYFAMLSCTPPPAAAPSVDVDAFLGAQLACTTSAKTLEESRMCRCSVQRAWSAEYPEAHIEITACVDASAPHDAGED